MAENQPNTGRRKETKNRIAVLKQEIAVRREELLALRAKLKEGRPAKAEAEAEE